ncbi:HAD-IB family phosphatase, partial [Pandoraea nosoerga]|nr:HAD-IB family phosphatase [Pandoraea nosoerga]
AQIALIGGDDADLDAVLDSVELTPGFIDFAEWCEANAVPLVVVSDGVDYFIRRILSRHGVDGLEVISNQLATDAAGARALAQPWSRVGCAAGSGVCKCQVAVPRAEAEAMVFIGDGRSDFCV